jgi:hypothetical protein
MGWSRSQDGPALGWRSRSACLPDDPRQVRPHWDGFDKRQREISQKSRVLLLRLADLKFQPENFLASLLKPSLKPLASVFRID